MSTLLTGNPKFDSRIVSRSQLATLPTPPSTLTHRTVPHLEVLESLDRALDQNGYGVVRESLALSKNGMALFGVIDLDAQDAMGQGYSFGFRTSNDKTVALRAHAGVNIFVCDNLALSGDVIQFRKHTSGFTMQRLAFQAVARFSQMMTRFTAQIRDLSTLALDDHDAKVDLFDLWRRGIVPEAVVKTAADVYFAEPGMYPDASPRTAWGLHNALTRGVKQLSPTQQPEVLTRLGQAFHLSSSWGGWTITNN